jgi:putative membrane protein
MKEKRHEVMKMKAYTVFSITGLIIVTLLIGGTAFANSGHGREIEDILAEIREDQGIGPGESIDPLMGPSAGGSGFGMMGNMPMMGWGMHGRRGSGGFGSFSGAMMGGFWPFLIWRIVMWIVVLGVIGVIVWLIVRTQKQQGSRGGLQGESPLDIVKRRYARGEITREEFENLKRDLQ